MVFRDQVAVGEISLPCIRDFDMPLNSGLINLTEMANSLAGKLDKTVNEMVSTSHKEMMASCLTLGNGEILARSSSGIGRSAWQSKASGCPVVKYVTRCFGNGLMMGGNRAEKYISLLL